jgi:hypothetical protein
MSGAGKISLSAVSDRPITFPAAPVLTSQDRAKLIAEVTVQLVKGFLDAASRVAVNNTIGDTEVNVLETVKSATALVYKAEEAAIPPKVPSSS